jgi:hypothetical protein
VIQFPRGASEFSRLQKRPDRLWVTQPAGLYIMVLKRSDKGGGGDSRVGYPVSKTKLLVCLWVKNTPVGFTLKPNN